jgi:4'-phosphopantetheinyl transferase
MLSDREVHVWNAPFDPSKALANQQAQLLSQDERERAGRFHFAKDRAHFIHARAVLRLLLGRYLDVPPESVTFRYGRAGKPELSPAFRETNLQFNVSHSHGHLLVAIARNYAVGVDIEKVRSEMNIEEISERFFCSAETQQLRTLSGFTKSEGFFNGWTRKEAYLKARGEGIGEGLCRFAVSLIPGIPARLLFDERDPDAVARWSIRELPADAGLAAALVVEAIDFQLKRLEWNAEFSHAPSGSFAWR